MARANGSTRTIKLDAYSEGYIERLGEFIAALARATVDGEGAGCMPGFAGLSGLPA